MFELLTGSHPFGRRYDSLLLVLGLGPLRAVCRRRIRQYRLDIDNEAFQAVSEEGTRNRHNARDTFGLMIGIREIVHPATPRAQP